MAKVTTTSGEKVDFGKYADPVFLNIDKSVSKRLEKSLISVEKTISAVKEHEAKLATEMKLAEKIAQGKLESPTYTSDFDAFISAVDSWTVAKRDAKSVSQVRAEQAEISTFTVRFLKEKLPSIIEDWALLFQQQQEKLRYIEDTYEDQETLEAVGKLYEIIVGDYNKLDNRISVLASLCPTLSAHSHGHPVIRINLEAKQAYAAAKQAEEVYEQSRLAELGGVVHF